MKQDVFKAGCVEYKLLWRARLQHQAHRRRAAARGEHALGIPPGATGPATRALGLTLLEVLITVTLIGLLSAIAMPSYQSYLERTRIATARKDILEYSFQLERYFMIKHAYPTSLTELGAVRMDPWGAPYQYLSMAGATTGKKRKDKSLNPLNSDYDLYSMGPDGQSQTPLTARASRDDIVRANNGAFIGVAEDY